MKRYASDYTFEIPVNTTGGVTPYGLWAAGNSPSDLKVQGDLAVDRTLQVWETLRSASALGSLAGRRRDGVQQDRLARKVARP